MNSNQGNVGTKGAPPAEQAAVVPGDAGVWAHDLWIMTASSYAVHVAVESLQVAQATGQVSGVLVDGGRAQRGLHLHRQAAKDARIIDDR